MTAFKIDAFENLEFDIPAGNKKSITISVPPLDCWSRDQSEAISELVAEAAKGQPQAFFSTRIALLYFTDDADAKAAVEALVPRQLKAIDDIWAKESGISVGESLPSTDSSSDKGGE